MHEEIKAYLEDNPRPEAIELLIADANGILRGKQFPGEQLEKLFEKGANLPYSLMFGDVRGATPVALLQPPLVGDPDVTYRVVRNSLQPVPWAKVPTAQVFLRPIEDDGSNDQSDPLTVLENMVERLNKDGLYPVVALEAEFYLLDPTQSPPVPVVPENGWPAFEGPQVYALEPLQDQQGFIDAVKRVATVQDIPLTSVLCEYGNSQFEMNLDHSGSIVQHARHMLMLKRAVKSVAAADGKLASFMAQPLLESDGSGCHIHVSVLNEKGENIFTNDEARLLHVIGGLMHTMAESMALCAPFANSYRRFRKEGWSPNSANWGRNHRLVSLRIPISGARDLRVEHRIAGADVNPYLLTAAVLAGVHYGWKNKLDPGPESMEGMAPHPGNALPTRWREALTALEASDIFRDYFGEEFFTYFCRSKFAEEENFHLEVTDRDYGWCLRTV